MAIHPGIMRDSREVSPETPATRELILSSLDRMRVEIELHCQFGRRLLALDNRSVTFASEEDCASAWASRDPALVPAFTQSRRFAKRISA